MQIRTTISLEETVSKLADQYCRSNTIKFSNLVENLLVDLLKREGLYPEDEKAHQDWNIFQELRAADFDFESAAEELAMRKGAAS